MVKNRYKNNSSESRGFQGIMIFAGQLRCYCLNKKQVLVASFEEDDERTLYPYTEWDFKITKSNERQQGIRAIHLMNANDKHDATTNFRTNRDRLIGKKLTNTKGDDEMTVAQYRSMIYGENKKRIGIIIREVINKYLKQNIS